MRRTLAAAAVSMALAASALPGATTAATSAPAAPAPGPTAREALEHVTELLADSGAQPDPAAAPEATIALRDLYAVLPRLTGSERRQAEALLARPTDGGQDPYGDGYTTRSRRTCATRVCVHWVPTTSDAPPRRRWVDTTLRVMKGVWRTEVGRLGYRAPLRDGRRGGNGRFDVYLKELGDQGLYGYCAPERQLEEHPRLASGYCVLDNDFARAQYGRRPLRTLRVTAAHEFFHAVQFGYDWREDRWLMEGSATWMEEQYADAVDDNRQYLPHGQLGTPEQPLDSYDPYGFSQYGNWVFYEYLSHRFGPGIVRRIWRQAGHFEGGGARYSTRAVERALPESTSFRGLYLQFTMANMAPGAVYPEGESWGRPGVVTRRTYGRHDSTSRGHRIDHLSAMPSLARPAAGLDRRVWQMRVTVDGPARETGPVAGVVRVSPSGGVTRTRLRLDAEGRGTVTVPFNRRQTRSLYVVVGNASTRFLCRQDTTYSCQGTSRDDGRRYQLDLEVLRSR